MAWLLKYKAKDRGHLFEKDQKSKFIIQVNYKMEQYFAEFKVTFSQTSLSSLADIFPVMAEYAIVFAVIMNFSLSLVTSVVVTSKLSV